MTQTELALTDLYLADETAWLDAMVELIESGHFSDLDYANLREYLSDMAKRERREVSSRLIQLLMHILKWEHQPDHRTGSWQSSIFDQQYELNQLAGRGVLRNHAEAVLGNEYPEAVKRAAAETGLPVVAFPKECPYSLDELLAFDPTKIEPTKI